MQQQLFNSFNNIKNLQGINMNTKQVKQRTKFYGLTGYLIKYILIYFMPQVAILRD